MLASTSLIFLVETYECKLERRHPVATASGSAVSASVDSLCEPPATAGGTDLTPCLDSHNVVAAIDIDHFAGDRG